MAYTFFRAQGLRAGKLMPLEMAIDKKTIPGVVAVLRAVGAIAIAEYVHRVADRYPVYVALHTDHCQPEAVKTFSARYAAEAARLANHAAGVVVGKVGTATVTPAPVTPGFPAVPAHAWSAPMAQ